MPWLLAHHARRTWAMMQKNDMRLIAFNIGGDANQADALKAYQVSAGERDGLLAIRAFYYTAR